MDDAAKVALVTTVILFMVTWIWLLIDRRSRAAASVRLAWSHHGRRWIPMLVGLMIFGALAEDVTRHEQDESVLKLDHEIWMMAKGVTPPVRRIAGLIGRLTGEGLAVFVALAAVGFAARGHVYRAGIVLVGTLGAWALTGILKVAYGIPRPRWNPATVQWGDGFPSGHALVTLVACLLIARAIGHDRSPRVRVVLWTCAWTIAFLAAGARVVANAHWTSDVVAGLALGAAWSAIVTMLADFWEVGGEREETNPSL